MALLLFTSSHSSFFPKNPNQRSPFRSLLSPSISSYLSFSLYPTNHRTRALQFRSLRLRSSLSDDNSDPVSGDTPIGGEDESGGPAKITDEWGEEAQPEAESSYTKLAESDPPKDEDEWGGDGYVQVGNGSPSSKGGDDSKEAVDEKLVELKRALVDTVYGTELGYRAGLEVRAEVLELVNQLEAANPTPAPTQAPELLDGNWVLLYTAFSELLPLLAAGTTPLLKVDKITQAIDSSSLTIVNSTTLSGPFATFTFSASAAFEVRSPSRIQVEFKEGTFQPPEIKSSVSLPEDVDVFGQRINLSPLQQTLNPLQEAVGNISRVISGQPPLKLPIPGERTKSWLITTYLDEDFRISRGDGGLFVLVKEGSPLLY
ncbi:plastoglobulin-1, chloroplastic [Ziziphus jujuba]|uniref:Plastoglobulin-1, chloroplastic n=1 Tax=Ziziphus jujuba TaxID=326968 RepID=A0A6P4B662_ZIZJJ|nr:plastoglobulin-1, chloroplastic [Ziziphus jujuba]XP_015897560.3 plastoglobulin-1, chloroplastic [Ziziphus jujuba]XP_048320282.2 plastoglobulin-1, chloroplastic [Ziziphus jujuba]